MKGKNQKIKNSSPKKLLFSLSACSLLAVSSIALAGCGDKPKDVGTKWFSGTDVSTITNAKVGDYFVDTDDYKVYLKDGNGVWQVVLENFGKPGENGQNGQNGQDGQDGQDGQNGTDGSKWFSGTDVSQATNAKVGDYFIDINDYKIYLKGSNNNWEVIIDNFGKPGNPGQDGQNGQDGQVGADGTKWFNGTDVSTIKDARTGDYFIDTDDYKIYIKESTGNWSVVIDNFGKPGNPGENGQNGQNGQDGTSVYIGYDGYIWNGANRTEFKGSNITLSEDVVENTIGIQSSEMSKYYKGEYLDLRANRVALMSNYKPHARLTQYSNSQVTKIKVVAQNSGILHIGTAKVKDIINARTTNALYSVNGKSYNVNKGLNEISLDLQLKEDETIVLGGDNTTAKLYYAKSIPTNDQDGNFTIIDGQNHQNIICKTGDYYDTLAIQVTAVFRNDQAVITTIKKQLPENEIATSDAVKPDYMPFSYGNTHYYAGKHITRIDIPVKSISSDTPTFTLQIVKINAVETQQKNPTFKKVDLTFPSDVNQTTKNQWVTAKCDVTLADDETLVFGGKEDTITWGYWEIPGNHGHTRLDDFAFFYKIGLVGANTSPTGSSNIYFDVYEFSKTNLQTHLQKLDELEEHAKLNGNKDELKAVLKGKNFSILGDSISTFKGYSNSTKNNNTIGHNTPFFSSETNKGIQNVNDSWWKQVADLNEMNILVNNSWSGSTVLKNSNYAGDNSVASTSNRAINLHDNTEDPTFKNGTNPDIIATYIGINDFDTKIASGSFEQINFDTLITKTQTGYQYNYTEMDTFAEAYAVMVHKMVNQYKNSDIFLFTLLPNTKNKDYTTLQKYNDIIVKIANHYNLNIVDLYNDSGITDSNLGTYLQDGLHPNALGMDKISDCFEKSLLKKYVNTQM